MSDLYDPPQSEIPENVFVGVLWGGFALSTLFSSLRFIKRYQTFQTLYIDDMFILLAWTLALASTITWQVIAQDMYHMGTSLVTSKQHTAYTFRIARFFAAVAVSKIMFYALLWCVKLSFLLFFRRLYVNMGRVARLWWAVLAFTLAAWACCMGTLEYRCLFDRFSKEASHCRDGRGLRYQRDTLVANAVLDITSDLAVTVIPISMLWRARIDGRRKVGLAAVFCVTLITMVIAAMRAGLTNSSLNQLDAGSLFMWTHVESYAALIVASLGSFRGLFHSQSSPKAASPEPDVEAAEASDSRRWRPLVRGFTNLFTATASNGSSRSRTENDTLQGIIDMYGSMAREPSSATSPV
ncbi:uncharacterized protein K452DRAFT_315037 [Aplosporella prunicola CBS 121167]|uniref:Rhodopsin domain-containing protein n=1 Tax=Aplosporella prunicola CBS 121167 TaxID=1176127 RepID=A0A6A6BRV3_9PEZI|nr:uncharacterized protein K452DRAFT_315037 [Aplosporella prunicola CBS 121167]KAF2146822.1 hypothetical protein K452DRAFT_315037 [Aplosporella prunicola CBS 121167]